MESTMAQPNIIIIGAGVCGLSIAWELLKQGASVTLFDKSIVGSGATNSSGGMLAAGIENEPSEAKLWDLTKYSQDLWVQYRHDLEKASGKNIDYRDHGTMMIATNIDDMAQVDFLYTYQRKLGVDVQMLSAREISKREPHLKTVGGMYCAHDHQVDSILVSNALASTIENMGGVIHTKTKVIKINAQNNIATGVTLLDGTIVPADKVIVCAGINTPTLEGIQDIVPVRPLKGQMVSLQMDINNPILEHVVWTPRSYLIPKSNGTLLIGATVEEAGFNNDNTAGGIFALLEAAWRALPATEDLKFLKHWVGHRPTARDDCPILGKLSIENAYVTTGHHRNGILLTPATGKIMADEILGNTDIATHSDFLNTFSIKRFI